jgi:putative spermidine/putrescine transport system permease protein
LDRVSHYALRALLRGGAALPDRAHPGDPAAVILPLSFNSEPYFSYPIPGWSLRWYENFFASEAWQRALRNSLVVAPATTGLATPLGTLAALGLTRPAFPGRTLVTGILISPMVAPSVITAVGMYFFYSRLALTSTLLELIVAHTALATPFVVIVTATRYEGDGVRERADGVVAADGQGCRPASAG